MKRLQWIALKAGNCLHMARRINLAWLGFDTGMTAQDLADMLGIAGRPMQQFRCDLIAAGLPYSVLFDRFYAEL